MPLLTIAASNRDRFDIKSDSTKWFIKSLQHQTCKDFELMIADGGSCNIEQVEQFAKGLSGFKMRVTRHQLGEKFERARLNNVGIRNATTPYIMTTDVDMFFASDFVEKMVSFLNPVLFIESRTMYWKPPIAQKVYSGKLDPFNDLDSCKVGRIKKRTTAGGCQCAHIDQWSKVRGFDERYIGWGSEDYDLLTRMQKSGAKVLWLGESNARVMVFHQPHAKNVVEELKEQVINQRLLRNIGSYSVNPNGWGGISD